MTPIAFGFGIVGLEATISVMAKRRAAAAALPSALRAGAGPTELPIAAEIGETEPSAMPRLTEASTFTCASPKRVYTQDVRLIRRRTSLPT